MKTLVHRDGPRRVALYCRVSSDEQAEKETIRSQVDFLHRYCELNGFEIVAEYLDDGVPGWRHFKDRPQGSRLIADAEAKHFDTVLFMRVSRFARRLYVALQTYQQLESVGVAIKSATESIDTSEPVGRLLFQLLGAFAEFDREQIIDNTTRGRARGAKAGRWYGVVPIGYTCKAAKLVPNREDVLPGLSEADLVRDIFERVANGSTAMREAMRLSGLGLRPTKRYVDHSDRVKVHKSPAEWNVERISRMVRSTIYMGTQLYKGKYGDITRPTPALVTEDLWERANQQLTRNRTFSKRNSKHDYLLSHLIRCGICGYAYMGAHVSKSDRRYYVCSHLMPVPAGSEPGGRLRRSCGGKAIDAAELEGLVWADCQQFLRDPGELLATLRTQQVEREQDAATAARQRAQLVAALGAKDHERQRIISLVRRGTVRDDEATSELDEIAAEQQVLQQELAALDSLQADAANVAAQHRSAEALLMQCRARLDAGVSYGVQQEIVRTLLGGITVETEGVGRAKTARVHVQYHFREPGAADEASTHSSANRGVLHKA